MPDRIVIVRSLVLTAITFLVLTVSVHALGYRLPPGGEDESFFVPTSLDRDEYVYDSITEKEEWASNGTRTAWTQESRTVHRFAGRQTIIDGSGQPRSTVVFESIDVPVQPAKQATANWGWEDDASRQYYDIASRDMVRLEIKENGAPAPPGQQQSLIPPSSHNRTYIFLGPDYQNNDAPAWRYELPIALQNRTFADGHDLSEEVQAIRGRWCDETHRERWALTPSIQGECGVQVRASVGERGTLLGEPVRAVHEWVHSSHRSWYPTLGEWVRYSVWSNATYWFSENVSVPLLVESHWQDSWYEEVAQEDWRASGAYTSRLAERQSKGVPVAWGPRAPVPVPSQASIPLLETKHPTSGPTSPLRYPLEDAIRSVETDPTLIEFALWRTQNPGSQLVGFRYSVTEACEPVTYACVRGPRDDSHRWTLLYSAPNGETLMRIRSDLVPSGQSINSIESPAGVPVAPHLRFDPSFMPDQFVTLEGLDWLWKSIVSAPSAQREPNYVYWGYAQLGHHDPATKLHEIQYGFTELNSNLESRASFISVNASTGIVNYGFDRTTEPAYAGLVPRRASGSASAVAPVEDGRAAAVLPWAAVASGSLLVLLIAYLYQPIHDAVVGFYSKLAKSQLLDNNLRDHIVALVKENPGISQPRIQKATGAGWSTLTYHLSLLSQNHVLTSARDGPHRRYFLAGTVDRRDLKAVTLLHNPNTARVRNIITEQPGVDRPTMARLLGVTPAAVTWHLKRLLGEGLVRPEPDGRRVRYFPARTLEGQRIAQVAVAHVSP